MQNCRSARASTAGMAPQGQALPWEIVNVARAMLVVLVGVAVGACAGDRDATVTLGGFADATRSAVTARFSSSSDGGTSGELSSHSSGVFDFDRLDGTMTFVTMTAMSGDALEPAEFVVVDGAAYMSLTRVGDIDPASICYGKSWGVFDPRRYGREDEADLIAPVPIDPGSVLDALAEGDARLAEAGSETIHSEPTTRYRVQLDGTNLAERFIQLDYEYPGRLASLDVWVDADGRLRRATWGVVRRGDDTVRTTVVELWDYGVAVDVKAPSEDDTCDFPAFFAETMSTFD